MSELSVHHSLICTASYMVHATGEEMLLRKFFKFGVRLTFFLHSTVFQSRSQVAKPLDVKTKFMNIEVVC